MSTLARFARSLVRSKKIQSRPKKVSREAIPFLSSREAPFIFNKYGYDEEIVQILLVFVFFWFAPASAGRCVLVLLRRSSKLRCILPKAVLCCPADASEVDPMKIT
ncbi:hypothetical protein K449DRAFT_433708 [Hypoxylon sp. EC38]|nr:hypothetical protein K449DRAFT_433708 [Hypoxylon sp. EC38]